MQPKRSRSWLSTVVLTYALLTGVTAVAEPVNPQARESVGYLLKLTEEEAPPGPQTIARAQYVGTAFAATYSYESATMQFMVTARHVVVDERGVPRADLLAQFPHEQAGSIRIFPLQPEKWLFHREAERIDLAVYPALPHRIQVKRVGSNIWIANEVLQEQKIAEGDEVFYTGLLLHYPGRALPFTIENRTILGLAHDLSPITRFGRLALVDDEVLYAGKSLYFLDADSMPGHSGSPVFLWASPSRRSSQLVAADRIFGLYGVVSNVLEWGRQRDRRTAGVTGIVPIRYLRELLESKAARQALGAGNQ